VVNVQEKKIKRFIQGTSNEVIDEVAEECKIKLLVNGTGILYFLTYPVNIDELAIGYLFSEGMISTIDDIPSREFDEKAGEYSTTIKKRVKNLGTPALTSGCARGMTFASINEINPFVDRIINYTIFIDHETISRLMADFQQSSEIFKRTGAVHLAAIATENGLVFSYEDIGRHNAVDKCLGRALLEGMSLHDKILLSSGRLSSEILGKVIVAGIPVVVSRAAPTACSIELGEKFGVTVIGFCRGKRFNIYSHANRVK